MTRRFHPMRDLRIRRLVFRDGLSYRQAAKLIPCTPNVVAGVIFRTTDAERAEAMRP